MKLNIIRAGALIAVLAFPFVTKMSAQNQNARLMGTVDSFDGKTLVVKTPDGKSTPVAIPDTLAIRANEKATLADIKPGDFVASAADKGPDGKVHAEELRIFPEAMRGAGEGHRPMGPNPNQSMTNGTVAAPDPEARTMTNGTVSATGAAGTRSITVKYKEGETVIVIDAATPVTRIVIADKSLLKPGAAVLVVAAMKDGALVANNVTAEKDGVKP
jgi:co-chaperonin GroES (HSP10)